MTPDPTSSGPTSSGPTSSDPTSSGASTPAAAASSPEAAPAAAEPGRRLGRLQVWLVGLVAAVIAGAALQATVSVAAPVAFAVFLALLVAPIDRWVANAVPSRAGWLGHVAAMGTLALALALFVGAVWLASEQVLRRFPDGGPAEMLPPQLESIITGDASDGGRAASGQPVLGQADGGGERNATGRIAEGPGADEATAGGPADRLIGALAGGGRDFGGRLVGWASGIAGRIVSAAGSIVFATLLVLFLTLFMLIEAPRWRRKLGAVLSEPRHRKTLDTAGVIAERLRRYLVARVAIGAATAALYVGWVAIFGLDLLLVWGLLAFALGFVPTFGAIVAGVLPVIYAFVQKDLGTAVLIGAGILAIEQVMGNFLEPKVAGRQVALSPLVVLVALLLWGWIWGLVGLLLAVPITVAVMIACAHVEGLRPVALLLSDRTDLDALDRVATRET
jgi:AI-2 transport protein TqsA